MSTLDDKLIKWLLNGDTGTSSKTIVRWILFNDKTDHDHPSDAADLRRCVQLLDLDAGFKVRFFERMPYCSELWRDLVANWEVLEATLKYEIRADASGSAPKTYKLLLEISGRKEASSLGHVLIGKSYGTVRS